MSAALLADSPTSASTSSADGTATTRWAGRILTGIAVLFLTFDLTIKLVGAKEAVDDTVQLGWQPLQRLRRRGVDDDRRHNDLELFVGGRRGAAHRGSHRRRVSPRAPCWSPQPARAPARSRYRGQRSSPYLWRSRLCYHG